MSRIVIVTLIYYSHKYIALTYSYLNFLALSDPEQLLY
jgi:hypothetical protein